MCPSLTEIGKSGVSCRSLDEGLHDSRGVLDRLLGVASPYACGFRRGIGSVLPTHITEAEINELIFRTTARLFSETSLGLGSSIRTVSTSNHVFRVVLGANTWPVVMPELGGYMGRDALVTHEGEDIILQLTDPHNDGKRIPVPKSVMREVERRKSPVDVEMNVTKPDGPWWFVDDCLTGNG